jgi:S1-C subfamily serine protease
VLATALSVTACDSEKDAASKSEASAEADAKASDAKAEELAKADAEPDPPSAGAPGVDATLVKNGPPADATPMINPESPESTPTVTPPPEGARTADEKNSIEVFEAAAPATVFVTQKALGVDESLRTTEVEAGAGTGFIWDADGHIVTNCHVALVDCAGGILAPKLTVTLVDHKKYDAKVIGSDPFKDIAVLKIEPDSKLVPIRQPAEGHSLTVGQKTIAIGNPFGLDHTLTVGVISALGREVVGIGGVSIREMVQTDAPLNPGNSGGPLLDSQGRLIGMNTMIFSRSGSSAGIGFAVPYSAISKSVPEIIKDGRPSRVGLGITKLDDGLARKLGVEGVVVQTVSRTSPAFDAGLRGLVESRAGLQFDVIVGIGAAKVEVYDDLYKELEGKKAGDTVKLQIMRMPGKKVFDIETELVGL